MKRVFDIIFSLLGLTACLTLFAVVAILIKLDSKGPAFFQQVRIGKNFRAFKIYKFRTMTNCNSEKCSLITISGDSRITRIGRFLRKTKIDELPQLWNILKGDMSFVGPRPELPEFVEHYSDIYKNILKVKPGITDIASIKFRNESSLLSSKQDDVENKYLWEILPQKLNYNKEYLEKQGLLFDIRLILKTIYSLFFKLK